MILNLVATCARRRGQFAVVAITAAIGIGYFTSAAVTASGAGPAASLAQWTAPISLPLVPVGGAVLSTGKVLFWASNQTTAFNGNGNTWTALFDPSNNSVTSRNVTETKHNMFCPGTARLPNGKLLINGGYDAGTTSIYDPSTDTWATGPAMTYTRGYEGTTPLWDGSVLTLGGSWSGGSGAKNAEVYTSSGTWKLLPGVPDGPTFMMNGVYNGFESNGHYNLIPTGNGKVLFAGPSTAMQWIDTQGNGSITPAGPRGDDGLAYAGNTVMYEAGRILKVGGSSWQGGPPSSATAYIIDTTNGAADVTKLTPMAYPRTYANSIVLPNGQVVVVGGQTVTQEFSDSYAVLAPELWDPATGTFTVLPSMSVARNYHSIAQLLPDGRVLSGGGGLCACSADHPDLQILSPPYLFNANGSLATRPVITVAPSQVNYGSTAAVTTDSPVTGFALVRLNATTHTVNSDQRRVSIPFTATDATHYQLSVPTNPGILLPGQWMLFAMNASGVPSIAKFVTVNNSGAPVVLNPGNISGTAGTFLSVPVTASTPSGTLTMSATGLPAGLSVNSTNGTISGTPTAAGHFMVNLQASNGTQRTSTDLAIDIATSGNGTGLTAQYYPNINLSGTVALQQLEAPSINLSSQTAPRTGVPTIFSTRWTGTVEAVSTGTLTIQTVNDDGARLWWNNQLVIDDWNSHAATTNNATVSVVAGQRYPVTIEYFQGGGSAQFQLNWQLPNSTAAVAIPTIRLYPGVAPSSTNLAVGKPATQVSTYPGGAASHAVDGNTDGNFSNNSVSHTNNSAPQDWWQVDLGSNSRIDLIQLWNRTDCCSDRLTNSVVFVASYDMTNSTLAQLNADSTVIHRTIAGYANPTMGIPINGTGRFVRVQLAGQNFLALAEVQVFGASLNPPPSITAIPNQQTATGTPVTLQVSASDPSGSTLRYQAAGLPAGLAIDSASGLITGVPTTVSTSAVTVTVTNSTNQSATANFTWTVLGPVPQVTSLTVPAATKGVSVSYSPALSAGAASTYVWDFGDGVKSAASSGASTTHTYASAGTFFVQLAITTTDGRSGSYSFVQAVSAGGATTTVPRSSSNLLITTGRLWVVNQDNDSVSVFDTATNALLKEVPVGAAPRSLAAAPDGRLWVVNKKSATISIVNATTFAVDQTVALPRASQPFGIVFSPVDGSALVTLEALGQVLKLNSSTTAQAGTLSVGPNPRHLAMDSTGTRMLVSRFITPALPGENTALVSPTANTGGEVVVVNPSTMSIFTTVVLGYSYRPDGDNSGSGVPNYLGAPAISPDGKTAWIPAKQDNVTRGTLRNGINLDFKHTVRSITSRIDLTSETEDLAGRVDHNLSSFASAAAYHPNGVYLFVALEGNRQVAVVDSIGKQELFRISVGLAPEGLAVSPDGLKLYVNNFMSRTVSVIDLTPLVNSGLSTGPQTALLNTVTSDKLAANILKGKQLFYDAADPRLAQQSYMSCAVCHNDGGHDGRVWDFTGLGEGLRNTISLKGRAGTGEGFMHWSANFDEVQDFEGQIRNFAGGTGLMADADFNSGTRSQPLGDPKAGISSDLDALAAYVQSLNSFDSSPLRNADGTLTASATSGKSVFNSQGCASCHGGAGFTLSGDATQLKDVGTIKPSSGRRLGGTLPGIDIPTLRDVWATAPYLHDGSAPTLADAVSAHNGVTVNATDLANLVDYLKQIGSDEPTPGVPIAIALSAPTAGASFTAPATITLAAAASGPVTKVEFYNGSTLLGTANSAPFAFSWTNVPVGTYTLSAIAYSAFPPVPSSPVTVTVTNPLPAPDFTLALTPSNLTVTAGASGTTTVSVNPLNGFAGSVAFSATGLPAGVTASFSGTTMTLSAATNAAASNSVPLTVTGVSGTLSHTATLSLTVTPQVTPLTVSLTSPANNSSYTAPATVPLTASATGAVTKVEFYNGATLLGTSTTSPYSFSWTNVAAGAYSLTARVYSATANQTSTPVSITVKASGTGGPPAATSEWKLDSVTGGVTADSQAAANNATVTGGYSLVAGKFNSAIKFDPNTGGALTQRAPVDPTKSFTVSAWVNLADTSGTQTFVSQPAAQVSNFYLQLGGWAGGTFVFDLYPSDSTSAPDSFAVGTTRPQVNTWYMVTGVYDATNKLAKVYVNGVLESQVSAPGGSFANTGGLGFGYSRWAGSRADGNAAALDEIQVWPQVLSDADVASLYSPTAPSPDFALGVNPASLSLAAGASTTAAVTVTPLNGFNSSVTYSVTGLPAGVTASFSGATLTLSAAANAAAASAVPLTITGTSGTLSHTATLSLTVTASQPPVTVTLTSPANNATYTAPATIALAASTTGAITKVEFYIGSTLLGTATAAPYTYSWTNVAAGTYPLSAKAYGTASTATSSTSTVTVSTAAAPLTVALTAPANNATYTAPASIALTASTTGAVTKVEFYSGSTLLGTSTATPYAYTWANVATGSYTLTAKAYSATANATSTAVLVTVNPTPPPPASPTPVSQWNLDTVSSGITPDAKTPANNATVTGGYSIVTGKYNSAIKFDPNTGGALTQRAPMDPTKSFSIAAWVNLADVSGTQTFVSQPAGQVSNFYLQLGGWAGGTFVFDLYPSDSTGASDSFAVGTTKPIANTWYHIVGVFDATAKLAKIYVNGRLEAQVSAAAGSFANSGPLAFGYSKWAGGRADGNAASLDDVRAWAQALTDTDVANLYAGR